ncbi:WXG100 family type VII secretion target [Amycolatopsis samaneae]|uniref:ESAT-6-like protein n=1 Tax=Amycolatopsis samaneae TaxID=664691 RepID=A0ABW5GL71_9PSEU
MSDAIKYDYQKLDEAFTSLTKIAEFIDTTLDEQRKQVHAVMADWHGDTADAYDSLSTDLDNDMKQYMATLAALKNAAHTGATTMQETDAQGKKSLAH